MTRLLMLVEGQSEEVFVKRTLTPHLAQHGVFVESPIVLWTMRLPSGGGFRGGVSNWSQIRRSLLPLTRDGDAWVTTPLFTHAVEPTLQRELKHKAAANGDGSYSAELIGYVEIIGRQPSKKPRLVTEAKCLILWCRCPESNWGPTHYECAALPTELQRHGVKCRQCRTRILAGAKPIWNPLCARPPTFRASRNREGLVGHRRQSRRASRDLASGGFLAKYLRMPDRIASAILS